MIATMNRLLYMFDMMNWILRLSVSILYLDNIIKYEIIVVGRSAKPLKCLILSIFSVILVKLIIVRALRASHCILLGVLLRPRVIS